MSGSLGTYVIFALGILVGILVGNKDFRYKFFKGLRRFLGGISQGARSYSERNSSGDRNNPKREILNPPRLRPEVQHIYKQVHENRVCSTCEGSGRVFAKVSLLQEGALGFKPKAITCPECEGEGKVWD